MKSASAPGHGPAALGVIVGAAVFLPVACVPPSLQSDLATLTPGARGQALFTPCAFCHGATGKLNSPAGGLGNLSFRAFKEGVHKESMNAVSGIEGIRKSDDDIAALIAYLATLGESGSAAALPLIPASHKYYVSASDNCTACHADLTNKVFQPFPANHVGLTSGTCLICHTKAADQDPPVLKLTVARVTSGPTLDGVAGDAAWNGATELSIPLKGGINSSETTMKIKAVHDGTTVFFIATWADPTESLERGPFVKQSDGKWKKTPYYPSNYEDKVGFLWHTGTGMDTFKTQGCAVTCHATTPNRDRPLKYVDSGTKIDMWHAKMVRTVMPSNVGQIDDQNIIWTDLLDDATGSGKDWDDMIKDGGRRGDPKTGGGYNDNPKKSDGSPKWMPAAEPFKVADGRSFWLSGATASFDDSKFVAGDKVAAIHVAKMVGDRGDISTQAKWASGTWTMEWSRALSPTNTDGRDVKFVPGGTYHMGAAFFDNAQIGHSVQFGVTEVTFAQ